MWVNKLLWGVSLHFHSTLLPMLHQPMLLTLSEQCADVNKQTSSSLVSHYRETKPWNQAIVGVNGIIGVTATNWNFNATGWASVVETSSLKASRCLYLLGKSTYKSLNVSLVLPTVQLCTSTLYSSRRILRWITFCRTPHLGKCLLNA